MPQRNARYFEFNYFEFGNPIPLRIIIQRMFRFDEDKKEWTDRLREVITYHHQSKNPGTNKPQLRMLPLDWQPKETGNIFDSPIGSGININVVLEAARTLQQVRQIESGTRPFYFQFNVYEKGKSNPTIILCRADFSSNKKLKKWGESIEKKIKRYTFSRPKLRLIFKRKDVDWKPQGNEPIAWIENPGKVNIGVLLKKPALQNAHGVKIPDNHESHLGPHRPGGFFCIKKPRDESRGYD